MTSQMKSTQLDEPMEKFYSKLLEFVEQSIENDEWDSDDFKTCFTHNMPVKVNKKTAKPVKDPTKPKRARGAYIFFSSDKKVREQIKKDNPEASSSEIMSLLGSKWSSDEYKNYNDEGENKDKTGKFDYQTAADKYFKMAAQDKERYTQEMSEYTPDPAFITVKSAKLPKVKTAPKRARTAYMFFCMEKRPEAKKELVSVFAGRELQTEVTKLLGEWWTDHKDYNDEGENRDKNGKFDYTEDAQKYVNMSEDDKDRVKSESDTGSDTGSDAGSTKNKKLSNKKAIVEAEYNNDDSDEDELDSDEDELDSDEDELDSDEDELDSDEDEKDCGCDFVYSRKKGNKKKGDPCGQDTVGDTGKCSKHKKNKRTSK